MPRRLRLCDMHCHILPGIDDGCKTAEESLAMLHKSWDQGIRWMFLTPHYDHHISIQEFMQVREASYQELLSAVSPETEDIPYLQLGAEVAFFQGISHEENLDWLCLGKSNYLLLEMPFSPWSPAVLRELNTLQYSLGIHIIIAHIERYLFLQDAQTQNAIFDTDFLFQTNSSFLLTDFRRAERLIRSGFIDFLGSDSHSPVERPQNLRKSADLLEKKGYYEELKAMTDLAKAVFRGEYLSEND